MSLAEEKNSEWYDGKGPGGVYDIPFRYHDWSWLKVTLLNPDGTATDVSPSKCSFSGEGSLGAGKLTTSAAPDSATTLIISRRAPATQNLSLTSNAPLPAKDLEKALDHLAMAIHDRDFSHAKVTPKALSFPIAEPEDNETRLPMPQQRKGMFLGFSYATGEMEVRPPSSVFHEGMTVALAAIEAAKTATLTVLQNVNTVAADLLAKIPLFYKKETEGGGIKFGDTEGDPAGYLAINLQSHRYFPESVASGPQSIAIGNSRAFGESSISIGNEGYGAGTFSTSVGTGNNANFQFGTAFGYKNHLQADYAVALGYGNSANDPYSVAVGFLSQSRGQFSSSLGVENIADGTFNSAIGHQNNTANELANAFGARNQATGHRSSAFGYGNLATGDCSSAFGYQNSANEVLATAIGAQNTASGQWSLAVGYYNHTSGTSTVAHGNYNNASGYSTIAIGHGNTVTGGSSVACGISNSVPSYESTATGFYNQVAQDRSAAFGRYNSVTGPDSGAIGLLNYVPARNSVAFGYETVIGTECVSEMANIVYGEGARVRADAHSTTVSLSFGYERPAPSATSAARGHEPSGTLADRMLAFRSDGYQLHIDVAVHNTIKTITLPLP